MGAAYHGCFSKARGTTHPWFVQWRQRRRGRCSGTASETPSSLWRVRHRVVSLRTGCSQLRVALFVGEDDLLHQDVPHHVGIGEETEPDALDVSQERLGLAQAAFRSSRQVRLSDVAGHDRLRAVAQPRQEHAHLFAGCVLRFIEDDETIVEGSTAHERERRNLDLATLSHLLYPVEVE